MPLPTSEYTLPQAAQAMGYATVMVGKWHLGDFKPLQHGNPQFPVSDPALAGFEQWAATERSAQSATINCGCFDDPQCDLGFWNASLRVFPCTNYYSRDGMDSVWASNFSSSSSSSASSSSSSSPSVDASSALAPLANFTSQIAGDDSTFIVDRFVNWLDSRSSSGDSRPFFAYLPMHTVHVHFVGVDEYRRLYTGQNLTAEQVDYYAAISALDAQVGRVRSELASRGLANNTLLWFVADNGPAKTYPGCPTGNHPQPTGGLRGCKADLLEGGVRVPSVVEAPFLFDHHRYVSSPVVTSDILPTLLDIWGAPPSLPNNRTLDGISVLPLFRAAAATPQPVDPITNASIPDQPWMRNGSQIGFAFDVSRPFFRSPFGASWVGSQYKLMASVSADGSVTVDALYDLNVDPGETTDVSGQQPTVTSDFHAKLTRWLADVRNDAENVVSCVASIPPDFNPTSCPHPTV